MLYMLIIFKKPAQTFFLRLNQMITSKNMKQNKKNFSVEWPKQENTDVAIQP